ncbi:MAG TPA: hypothetical protein VFS40_14565, partial [Gemmatimonadales bacterium]|nr:hypothetical protein [Gemmatimonadales bacterium]
ADFVAVELTEGDHVLRTTMRTPDGREEWNDVFVHRSGAPNWLELAGEAPVLHVDDAEPTRISVRVLDRWDVPLVTKPAATVEAHGVVVEGTDADPSSVGEQRLVDQDGWLVLLLRPGSTVAPGLVKLTVGDVKLAIPFRVLPSARPFTATGVGLVGVGAAPESFGAVTVQGALGRETAVSMSFDSRRGRDRNDYFGRGYDPLDDGRYATYGDGSDRRVLSSATGKFSARIEHGFDWLELGDVQTTGFGQSRLGAYQRSLTGVRGRFATGPVVWTGFGSVTHQALERQQLRGDGSSGPFVFGGGIRPGTERVAIEVRAYDNAARLVTRQELVRYTDYEVDYATGAVLLRQPVASVDLYGNPVYVVATVERESGGAAHTVGGLRMETDVSRLLFKGAVDSLGVGLTGVRDGAGNGLGVGSADLVGADVRLRERGFELGAELLHARSSDSTALATRADAGWRSSDERLRVDASWLRVGGGFGSALDPRLASALTEVRLGGDLRL